MLGYIKISLGIFIALAASRLIPHPPNFTSLMALSFYIPAILGIRFIPALIVSFLITDLIIGFHGIIFFTWGSVIVIGLMSKFFSRRMTNRVLGALMGACLFYIITNFGVWSLGSYGYTLDGLITCYVVAIPFFGNTLVSTIFFSLIIEFLLRIFNFGKKSISSP
tara:strand:- start:1024 stop:1518 length:495 start_codon:yes stop_codon:yes gene_type:complete